MCPDVPVLQTVIVEPFPGDAAFVEPPHLIKHAVLQPLLQALGYPAPYFGTFPADTEHQRPDVRPRFMSGGLVVLESGNFDGPDGAAAVGQVGAVVLLRPQGHEPGGQFSVIQSGQFGPQGSIFGHLNQAVSAQRSIQVQAGAAADNRQPPPTRYIRKGLKKTALEGEDTELGAGLDDVDQVIGHVVVLGQVLAGADVHAAEDLARIGRDYFAAQFPGKFNSQAGLARGGGTEDNEQIEPTDVRPHAAPRTMSPRLTCSCR